MTAFWGIKFVVTALLLAATVVFCTKRFGVIAAMIWSGKKPDYDLKDQPGQRLWNMIRKTFLHEKVLEDPVAGIMHMFFLYGFFLLGIGHMELVLTGLTALYQGGLVYADIIGHGFLNHAYHFSQEIMAALIVPMSVAALVRRWSGKVKRLMPRSQDAENILWIILMLYITFFLFVGSYAALEMKAGRVEEGFHWYWFISSLIAQPLSAFDTMQLEVFNLFFFVAHLAIFLGFAAYLSISKHMHLIFAFPNIYFYKRDQALGIPEKIDFMDETLEKYGNDRITEFTWKSVLDTFACTECGRCNAVCPAHTTGKPLQPKKVLHDLKDNLRKHNFDEIAQFRDKWGAPIEAKADEEKAWEPKLPLIAREAVAHDDPNQVDQDKGTYLQTEGQVHLDELWACTTCAACVEACPVLIDSVPGNLISLRQNLVMMEADFPQELNAAFRGMEVQGNPWGIGQDKREEWTTDLDVPIMKDIAVEDPEREVEYLFWVGCAGATDDRSKKTQKALVKILKKANVDFGILGCEEKCTGDTARRLGNEYVFDALAQENIATLAQYKFKKIFTACPHCFNILGNEYGQYGVDYSIQHHTELLDELMKDNRIPFDDKKKIREEVAYHDPCYLSRYNEVVDEPRNLLEKAPGVSVKEMDRNKKQSFCCGAGGGRMWMEEHIGERVNVNRTQEALVTLNASKPKADANTEDAKTIAVGCPFCMTMITDGTKAEDAEHVQVKDIAEIIAERI